MSSSDDTASDERIDHPNCSLNDEANSLNLAPPHLVQIHARKAEINRRIDAWIRNKRQEIDILNVEDFCLHAGFSKDTCARVDAMHVHREKPLKKKLCVRDISGTVLSSPCIKIEELVAPCIKKEDPVASCIKTEESVASHIKIEELVPPCIKIEEPVDSHIKTEEPVASCSKAQEPVASCSRDQEPVASCSRAHVDNVSSDEKSSKKQALDERIEERLSNVEKHLKIKRPYPGDVYARLKDVENRLLFLEGISLEYFSNKVVGKEAGTEKRTYTVNDIEGKIKTLKAKLN